MNLKAKNLGRGLIRNIWMSFIMSLNPWNTYSNGQRTFKIIENEAALKFRKSVMAKRIQSHVDGRGRVVQGDL